MSSFERKNEFILKFMHFILYALLLRYGVVWLNIIICSFVNLFFFQMKILCVTVCLHTTWYKNNIKTMHYKWFVKKRICTGFVKTITKSYTGCKMTNYKTHENGLIMQFMQKSPFTTKWCLPFGFMAVNKWS